MKTFFRIFVVVALLAVALQGYLSSGAMRSTVESELEAALARDVQVEDLDISIVRDFPNLSVALENVVVQDPNNAARPLMEIPVVYVNVATLPIFQNQLICDVEIDAAEIHATVYADGSSSLDDLISEEWLAGDEAESSFEVIDVQGFRVTNSTIDYQNARGRELGVVGLGADMAVYLAADSTSFSGDLTTTSVRLGAEGVSRQTDLSSQIRLTLAMGEDPTDLRFTEATLLVGPHELDLTGLPIDWEQIPYVVDLAVRLKDAAELPNREALEREIAALESDARRYIEAEKDRLREDLENALDNAADRAKDAIRDRLNRLGW